ncbi:IS30 family transposase [Caldalkalibacillus thermarum]|nr:IS30 family transposase [Caldalkalibacillus thermarum]
MGQRVYESNRSRCGAKYKLAKTMDFIHFAVQKIREDHWSPDAVCGYAKTQHLFDGESVCTKTLYRYIDLGLLPIKNIDLPLKVSRNTKKKRTRQHKKMLGTSIEQRPRHIDERLEFGHWEIDTVLGNGAEFSELSQALESQVYYTHPYTSWERGTNERHNGPIRRFIPKGKSIDDIDPSLIIYVENWCNTLPRKILAYRSPNNAFNEELRNLALS